AADHRLDPADGVGNDVARAYGDAAHHAQLAHDAMTGQVIGGGDDHEKLLGVQRRSRTVKAKAWSSFSPASCGSNAVRTKAVSSKAGKTASPSGSASTSVMYRRLARGRAAANMAVPPMTQTSSTPSSAACSRAMDRASSSVEQTTAPLARPASA